MSANSDKQSGADTRLIKYIRREMQRQKLSLRDVERRSGDGITNAYLSQLLSGKKSNPSLKKLYAIAKGLNVAVGELVSRAMSGK